MSKAISPVLHSNPCSASLALPHSLCYWAESITVFMMGYRHSAHKLSRY